MESCHRHNRRLGAPAQSGTYGIRMGLPPGDPMRAVLGENWETTLWFASASARDKRLAELTAQFAYYRKGDRASLTYIKVDPEAADTGG